MPIPDDIQQANSDRNTSPASSNDSSDGFDLDDVLDNLTNFEEGDTIQDVVGEDSIACWNPCGPSGSSQKIFLNTGECPEGYTTEEPDCSYVDDLLEMMTQTQEQVEEAQEQAEDLAEQTEEILSGGSGGGGGIPYPPASDTQKAGLDIPKWAIYGGIALAAVIAVVSMRKKW